MTRQLCIIVAVLLLGGCVAAPPRDTQLEPFDWNYYVELVPCRFDQSCPDDRAGAQMRFAEPEAAPLITRVDAPLAADGAKPYLEQIRVLQRALQQEQLERAQLERQLQALREIDREVARASAQATP
jgi:hypothetical protein